MESAVDSRARASRDANVDWPRRHLGVFLLAHFMHLRAVFHLGPLNLIGVRPEPGHRLGQPALFERRQVFGHGLCGPR
jgi:hypothetical protein